MHSGLTDGIRALLDAGASDDARARIVGERDIVDELLADPATPPIYGFTTLLGHLDDAAADVDDQSALLRAHLVGPLAALPAGWGRLLLRVKLAQLAHGGSGIHPETHARLVAASAGERMLGVEPWQGNWTTSYSSGDVVPGAWFVEALRARGAVALTHPGDLISLINGHFVSTTAGLLVADRFTALCAEALSAVRAARDESATAVGVQLPVTIRDARPLEAAADATTAALLTALHSRLAAPSANPRFEGTGTGLHAVSGSGFLDFRLTGALTQAVQACGQIGAYLKAVVRERTITDAHDSTARVQPTKIAEALLREISASALPTDFAIAESLGVEDVADFSLATARILARALQRLDALLDIATSVSGAERVRVPGALSDATGLDAHEHAEILAGLAA